MDRSTVCRLSHSATVTLGARSTSRTCLSGFSDRRLDLQGHPGELVEEEGVEPSFAGCRPAVLPLNDSPENWLRAGELNATRLAYEASMTPVHLPAGKWSPAPESNWLFRITGPAHRHLCLQGVILEPEGVFETPASALRVRCSANLSYSGLAWSECGESNSVDRTGDPMPNQ